MIEVTKEFLAQVEENAEKRKREILNTKDSISIKGTVYYVSNDGNDENDGKSPEKAWKSLEKVSQAVLLEGDGVCFRRGDLFRGSTIIAKTGVTYFAYGEGEKPKFYGGSKDMADEALWTLFDKEHNIWKFTELTSDVGTIVFNHGEKHSRKLIPSFIGGKFVCRNEPTRDFDVATEMTENLDIFCDITEPTSVVPSKGEDFPIPNVSSPDAIGSLYLRCDEGNPGKIFDSIEFLSRKHMIRACNNVTIDNLCIKYVGMHGIACGTVKNLKVTNCEIGWIGGCIQHYSGTDPNYPQGTRGTVTRFGNGIEVYGGCDNYEISDCYIYQVYDAGVTHQVTTLSELHMDNISYHNNVIEHCVYGIEYFLEIEKNNPSSMKNIRMFDNIIRFSGYGWGQQRHNTDTPSHIKGWEYLNRASDYKIYNNIFDRAGYRMVHLVALDEQSLPEMSGNTYIQHKGKWLGQYGANEVQRPEMIMYDENVEENIKNILNEKDAKVYII